MGTFQGLCCSLDHTVLYDECHVCKGREKRTWHLTTSWEELPFRKLVNFHVFPPIFSSFGGWHWKAWGFLTSQNRITVIHRNGHVSCQPVHVEPVFPEFPAGVCVTGIWIRFGNRSKATALTSAEAVLTCKGGKALWCRGSDLSSLARLHGHGHICSALCPGPTPDCGLWVYRTSPEAKHPTDSFTLIRHHFLNSKAHVLCTVWVLTPVCTHVASLPNEIQNFYHCRIFFSLCNQFPQPSPQEPERSDLYHFKLVFPLHTFSTFLWWASLVQYVSQIHLCCIHQDFISLGSE